VFVCVCVCVCVCGVHSVGYTMDTMYFGPMPNAIDISPDLEMPQFSLVDTKHRDCSMNYTSGTPHRPHSRSHRPVRVSKQAIFVPYQWRRYTTARLRGQRYRPC